jgi:hypothetical protein
MGECAYYLKAEFKSNEAAKIAASKLDDFFVQARNAYEFFQNYEVSLKTFWKRFEAGFPMVFDYVKTLPKFKSNQPPILNQSVLSGYLDFGQDENNETLVHGTTVGWGDTSVWHMTDWTPLCKYIVKKFGAIKAVWGSENECASLDSLQLYAYEEIIKNILKRDDLLPLLIGIHPDLDLMLDINAKH